MQEQNFTLYSFRRCPYAIRCRMVLHYSQVPFRVYEVSLKDKPRELLELSKKEQPTVPVLQGPNLLLEESWDIMKWALKREDPENWWCGLAQKEAIEALRIENDGFFKLHLDRYKYPSRYGQYEPVQEARECCVQVLTKHERNLGQHKFLLAEHPTLADIAVMSFVRQFAGVIHPTYKFSEEFPRLHRWLEDWKASSLFQTIMSKEYRGTY